MTLADLRRQWEQRRDEWRRLGVLVDGAKLADEILAELEHVVTADADELLTLTDAAREAQLHPDSIGRAIRQGRIRNEGRPHAPRVRRRDLETLAPRKRSASRVTIPAPSLPAITREAIAGKLPRVPRG